MGRVRAGEGGPVQLTSRLGGGSPISACGSRGRWIDLDLHSGRTAAAQRDGPGECLFGIFRNSPSLVAAVGGKCY